MLPQAKDVRFDAEADAAYVVFSASAVSRTSELEDGIFVDYDEAGKPIGVEILSVRLRAGANDPRAWATGVAQGLLSRRAAA